jgi:hypothetical protein
VARFCRDVLGEADDRTVVVVLVLHWRAVAAGAVQSVVVEPVDPLQGGHFDLVETRQGPRRRMSPVLYSPIWVSARALTLRCESRNLGLERGSGSGRWAEGDGLSEVLQFVDELADAVLG